ncbi:hypothetical protein [uncultured Intestinimonas sp.]|uniref:hypothetical protein n=1 Tax=uncultured Intestinimonas sp. TaxID=1689265 RepID=UPI0029435EA2|nr:hypothetical protein [uncultured Intestinimonas sp.]
MARTINVEIIGQFVRKDSKNAGVMGEGGVTTLHLTFDKTWSGFGKRIVWRDANGEHPVSVVLMAPVDVDTQDGLVYDTAIPREALTLPGWCSFSVEGYKEEGGKHVVSLSITDYLEVAEAEGYHKPAEPTPTQTQQLLETMAKNEEIVRAAATEAKSWAVGGTGSREGEDTDNAKYYAGTAAAEAEKAAESAVQADGSAQDAAASATAAAQSASEAARSQQEAAESEAAAKSWAVGGTGTRPGEDRDNAKYYSDIAKEIAGGGVLTFNGRGGNVLPQEGDYSNDMITGSIRATVLVTYNGGGN